MKKKNIQIAIDGPAGTGKSSIAKLIAKKFGNFAYINTGSMYRALAYYILDNKINYLDENELFDKLKKLKIDLKDELVFIDDGISKKEISNFIRTKEIEQITSKISIYPKIRNQMVELQRKMSQEKNVILDGRDIGSVVLPNAQLKIYLDASVDIRAQRRYKQIINESNENNIDISKIKKLIQERDYWDQNREYSPLVIPTDAIYIDTSNKTIDEIVDYINCLYKEIDK